MAKNLAVSQVRLEGPMTVYLKLETCKLCPYMKTQRTMGAGCAEDWICIKGEKPREIKGYIEYPSEDPKEIPEWCPLRKTK